MLGFQRFIILKVWKVCLLLLATKFSFINLAWLVSFESAKSILRNNFTRKLRTCSHVFVLSQPSPQGLLPIQNGGWEKPLAKAAKRVQKFVGILSRQTRWNVFILFEQRFQIARKQTGLPDPGNNLQRSHFIMCHVTKYFSSLGQGFLRPTILNEEKELGTRLVFSYGEPKLQVTSQRSNWHAPAWLFRDGVQVKD